MLTAVSLIQAVGAVLDPITGRDAESVHRAEELSRAGCETTGDRGGKEGAVRPCIPPKAHKDTHAPVHSHTRTGTMCSWAPVYTFQADIHIQTHAQNTHTYPDTRTGYV